MRSCAAFLLTLLAISPAAADEVRYAGIGDAVPGHPAVTYLDLLRQIAPDLDASADGIATGTLARDLPYLSGGDPSASAGTSVSIQDIAALTIRSGGSKLLAVLVDLGDAGDRVESFTALAVFDGAANPKLLDVVDVSTDRFTTFFSPPLLDLSPDDQAITIRNEHSNSNQSYESTTILFVSNDRLHEIGSILSFSDWSCGYEHRQVPSLEIEPSSGASYSGIRAAVRDEVTASGEDCGDEKPPTPFERTVSATFRWDEAASRFLPDSDALDRLAADNENRF